MSSVEVVQTIEKGRELPEMEEIDIVRPESLSNEHEMENLAVKDAQEDDSRPEDICTHPPEASDVHVEVVPTPPSVKKTKNPSRTMKPASNPPPIHHTQPSLLIGDLVWARVSPKAQWWPGMVAYDPRLVQYFRFRAKDGRLEYHIQWFGKGAHRSWVSVPLMDPMVRADQHSLLQRTGSVALRELKEALSLSRRERRVSLTFDYGSKRPLPAVGGGKKAGKGKEHRQMSKGGSLGCVTSVEHEMKEASSAVTPTAISEDTPTAILEDTPTATSEDTPPTPEDTPTMSEDTPPTPEDTPTMSEDTPTAPSEDTPTASSEDTPRTPEDTPTVVSEDTPTVVSEDTPTVVSEDTPTAMTANTPPTPEDTPTVVSEDAPTAMSEDTPTNQSEDTPTIPSSTWTAVGSEGLVPHTPSESPSPPLPEEAECPIPLHLPTPPDSSPSVSPHPSEVDPPTQAWPPDCRKRPSMANCNDTQDQKKRCLTKGEPPVVAMELQSNASTSEKEGNPIIMEVESISSEQPPAVEPPVTLEEGQCSICFEDSRCVISCSKCGSQFDCGCLGITHLPSPPFVCSECIVAATRCFFCESVEGDLTTCSHRTCLRRYHKACMQGREGFVFHKGGGVVCPLHACIRCHLTPEETRRAPRAPLISCTKCLLTLHSHPSCLVAGCEPTSPRSMVCYQHLQKRRQVATNSGRGLKMPAHINLDWCYTCGEGGLLLCCDLCATAYHAACVGDEGCGEAEQWVCPDCQRHNVLTYGGLAWCKCGVHKWWPCEVLPHKQVPEHLWRLKPVECMFLVRFFGTGEHWWTHHGRCVKYHLPDQVSGSKSEGKDDLAAKAGSKTEALLKKALQEVAERALLVSHQEKTSKRYIYLKSNKYLVHFPSPSDGMHLEMCQCSEESPCDDESRCVNRASKIECSKQTCKLGDSCRNRRLRNADYAACVPFYTGNRGWGLKTTRPVAAGEFVVEYVGEVIDEGMCRERLQRYHEEGKQSFYILSLVKGLYIDAAAKANKARFINHSCQPNLETQKWMVDGKTRIGLFSLTDIPAGTELTFDYQLDSLGHSKMACRCGSPNCSGLLGEKARSLLTNKAKGPTKKKRKQQRSRKVSSTAVE